MQSPAPLQFGSVAEQHEFGQQVSPGEQQNEADPYGFELGAKQQRLSFGQHPWSTSPQQCVPE